MVYRLNSDLIPCLIPDLGQCLIPDLTKNPIADLKNDIIINIDDLITLHSSNIRQKAAVPGGSTDLILDLIPNLIPDIIYCNFIHELLFLMISDD
jgi:hypothetical protein